MVTYAFSRKISPITRLTHVLFSKTPGLDVFILIDDLDWLSINFELFHDNITMASHMSIMVSHITVNLAVCPNNLKHQRNIKSPHYWLCEGNPQVTWVFSLTKASNAIVSRLLCYHDPDSKVHGAYMGPTWVLSAPGGPNVGPMILAIWGENLAIVFNTLFHIMRFVMEGDFEIISQ